MSFSDGVLERVGSTNTDAGVLWKYKENETLAAIRAGSYFDTAQPYGLADGDVVMIFASDGFGMSEIAVAGTVYSVGESITSA